MSIADQAAFPEPAIYAPDGSSRIVLPVHGMTYRQWLVGMALQGALASGKNHHRDAAAMAVNSADFAIAAMEQTP